MAAKLSVVNMDDWVMAISNMEDVAISFYEEVVLPSDYKFLSMTAYTLGLRRSNADSEAAAEQ